MEVGRLTQSLVGVSQYVDIRLLLNSKVLYDFPTGLKRKPACARIQSVSGEGVEATQSKLQVAVSWGFSLGHLGCIYLLAAGSEFSLRLVGCWMLGEPSEVAVEIVEHHCDLSQDPASS